MSAAFYLLTLFLGDCPARHVDAVPTDAAKVTIHTQVYEESHFYIRPRDSDCKALVVNRAGLAGAALLHKAAEGSDWVDVTGWWACDDVFVVERVEP